MKAKRNSIFSTSDGRNYLVPFALVTTLFFLWGFAHSILDVLNKHFQDTFEIGRAESALVQAVVYGGYFLMALPAGRLISRYGYRAGVLFYAFHSILSNLKDIDSPQSTASVFLSILKRMASVPDIEKRVGSVAALASELDCGVLTLIDIVAELKKPGRDPRDDAPEPVFSRAALSIDDLQPGMELTGTVRNVVDFGAFVDVGVHQDGLVHISKLANRFVKHPSDVVAVGDTVKVWVERVDRDRGKISLTMVQGK